MKWNVRDNNPPLIGLGARVYCDDRLVPRVKAFDTDEGWVEANCLDGHSGAPGRVHLDPTDRGRVCTVRLHGAVRIEMPERAP